MTTTTPTPESEAGTQPVPATDARRVEIVILSWNAFEYTKRCLETIWAESTYPNYGIVMVDNGSTDETLPWLRRKAQAGRITLVENGRNLGFTAGVNVGLAHTSPGADVITLNNDIVITQPDWIERLQDCAYGEAEGGLVGCRLVEPDGRLNHAGSFMPPVVLQGEQIAGRELDVGQYTARRPVQCNIMAVLYIPRHVIDDIGGIHPEYFSYFEDTDYCLEATKAGYKVWYAGDVELLHFHNTSTKVNKVDFWGMYNRSKDIFRRRWTDWLQSQYDFPLTWYSTVSRPRGYATHSRLMMRALQDTGAAVSYRPVYRQTDGHTGDPVIEDMRQRKPADNAPRIAYSQCDAFVEMGLPGKHIGFSMLEVTGLPEDWAAACNIVDEVWVPSEFNVETFRHAGVRTPIKVVPLGIDPQYYHPNVKRFRKSDDFVFLSVFDWGERKNPETLLRAYNAEFRRSDDTVLVLFVSNSDPNVDVQAEIADLRLDPKGGRVVLTLNANLPDHQMPALYKSADAFVLPTRGEGWGMPVLEAMAVGVPTIATDWSGVSAFLDDTCGYPIEVPKLIPAVAKCPYYEGWEWADPSQEHLQHLMRHVYENPEDAAAKAAAGAERAMQFTWAHTAQHMRDHLA